MKGLNSQIPIQSAARKRPAPLDACGCAVCWNDHAKLLGKEGIHAWSLRFFLNQKMGQKVMGNTGPSKTEVGFEKETALQQMIGKIVEPHIGKIK